MNPMDFGQLAWEAEKYLIPSEEWDTSGVPPEALAVVEKSRGVPVGIARHPKYGWIVLESSGQGPYVVWWERERA